METAKDIHPPSNSVIREIGKIFCGATRDACCLVDVRPRPELSSTLCTRALHPYKLISVGRDRASFLKYLLLVFFFTFK